MPNILVLKFNPSKRKLHFEIEETVNFKCFLEKKNEGVKFSTKSIKDFEPIVGTNENYQYILKSFVT